MQNLSEVNIKALAETLSETTGYYISLVAEICTSKRFSDKQYINIESNELKQHTGIMASTYKTVKISNFGGGLTEDGNDYWMPIHFSFSYFDGGSNGAKLATAYFNFEKQTWAVVN